MVLTMVTAIESQMLVWCGYALLGHNCFWFGDGNLTGSQILVITVWENCRHLFSLMAESQI